MKGITITITLLLFCAYINAQQAFTNSGNFQIHTGASVTGFGNFTNTSTATIINNGSFYEKGNIVNDQSAMATGTGILYINGGAAQTLSGSQPYKTL
jgi:hypothetical protein